MNCKKTAEARKKTYLYVLTTGPKSVWKEATQPEHSWHKTLVFFAQFRKKTNKVNTRGKDRFLRTPYFFLKNKILWSNVFSYTPRHCSVWTSQAIKNSNFRLQLTYFKREEYYEARRDFSPCPPSMYIAKKYWILWGPPNGHVPELMVYIMGWRSCSGSSEAGIEVDLVWRSFGTLNRPF